MKLSFEYGPSTLEAVLPDHTDVFIPGQTVPDPPCIPPADLPAHTRHAIENPIGMPPLSALAHPGDKCVIIFPDRVKGGEHPASHRRICIPILLDTLYAAGVRKQDILLLCSNGLHRKNTLDDIRCILGDPLVDAFAPTGQILSHDAEDPTALVNLGLTPDGDPVLMNRHVYDADLAILVGHVQGNPYGGYSGGYKHAATGITHWRSIQSHHTPGVMHRADFTPVSHKSLMRDKFDAIGRHMEHAMGKKFFCCDAVLDSKSRPIAVLCGYATEMMPQSWAIADRRTYVHWAQKKYDILAFGMPQKFHYGDGMGTNPIMLMQAISAQVIRHRRVLSDRCVVLCASACDGDFHEDLWPYTRALYNLYQLGSYQTLPDLDALAHRFATDPGYIDRYRNHHAYHPFHGFSMIACAHIAQMQCADIYIIGAHAPGFARGMGMKTRATFEEALADATRTLGLADPSILALPQTFLIPSVHLCMQEQPGGAPDERSPGGSP